MKCWSNKYIEEQRVETFTQEKPSKEGRKRTREPDILVQDARENVGAPSNLRKQTRSLERHTGYMALMAELIETKPSYFDEEIEQPIWVDAMVEEYKSIVKKNVWEVVPRPSYKSRVGSRWIFKVKPVADKSIEKYKAIFVAKGYSRVEDIDYEETFSHIARYSSIRSILALAT